MSDSVYPALPATSIRFADRIQPLIERLRPQRSGELIQLDGIERGILIEALATMHRMVENSKPTTPSFPSRFDYLYDYATGKNERL